MKKILYCTASAVSVLCLIFLCGLPFASSQAAFDYSENTTCPTTLFFYDISSLQCTRCGNNKVFDKSSGKCICATGLLQVNSATGGEFLCSDTCAQQGRATLRDGSACITCDNYDTVKKECVCPSGSILVERDAAGRALVRKSCLSCPSGKVNPSNAYECMTCPDSNMAMNAQGECVCSASYAQYDHVCLLQTTVSDIASSYPPAQALSITYREILDKDQGSSSAAKTVNPSALFNTYYVRAAVQCKYEKNREACQTLANLCALQLFDKSSTVCRLFTALESTITTISNGFAPWKLGMPWLYYTDDRVLIANDLQMKVTLSSGGKTGGNVTADNSIAYMTFKLATYAMNGTYLGLSNLTDQTQLCAKLFSNRYLSQWRRFGSTYEASCALNLADLSQIGTEPIFYEPYLVDSLGRLYPIPVKVLNLRVNGAYPNQASGGENTEVGSLVLTRRFFMVDAASSIPLGSSAPEVLTYAQSITLRFTMQSSSDSLIYPPVMVINYAQRPAASISQGSTSVRFHVEYTRSISGLWTAAIVLFSLAIVAIVLLGVTRMAAWQRTNYILNIDLRWLLRALLIFLGIGAEFFFWMTFALTAYCFIFFKMQQTAYFLLPSEGSYEYTLLAIFVGFSFAAKTLHILFLIYRQVTCDIFFVDWERSRSFMRDSSDAPPRAAPVSVWRKVFAANKYSDLMTERLLSIVVTLVAMGFLLRGVGLENLATSQPDFYNLDSSAAPINPILRFFLAAFLFIVISGVQLVYKHVFYTRYYSNKAAEFVDLLCTANISCFLFDEKYHCFYVHGKSVHAHADSSMEELYNQIAAEKRNLTRTRGLTEGIDTFRCYVSQEFRDRYDREYHTLLQREEVQRQRIDRTARRGPTSVELKSDAELATMLSDRLVTANTRLNEFLVAYIEKNLPDYPWTLRERSFFERRFAWPPSELGLVQGGLAGLSINGVERRLPSIFYEDATYEFTSTVLLGMEYDLMIFEALLFTVSDLAFGNTLVSVLITYLVDLGLVWVRQHYGKLNLARKTLIDERFMI